MGTDVSGWLPSLIAPEAKPKLTAGTTFSVGQAFRATAGGQATKAVTRLRHIVFGGVALSSLIAGAQGTFQTSGIIDPSIFTLPPGVACAVGVDANSNLVRATDPSCVSSPNWVGDCDTNGVVTINQRRNHDASLLDFGAIWDNVHDDTPAWHAAQNSVPVGGVGSIRLPNGLGYIAGFYRLTGSPNLTFSASGKTITRSSGSFLTDGFAVGQLVAISGTSSNNATLSVTAVTASVLTVSSGLVNEGPVSNGSLVGWGGKVSWKRSLTIIGTGGGNAESPQSGIRLPPMTRIDFDDANTSGDGGDSRHSRLRFADILQKTPICSTAGNSANYGTLGAGVDVRVPNQYVEVGTWVLYSGATASGTPTAPGAGPVVAFRCVAPGTPLGAEPAGFATATIAQVDPSNGSHFITDTGGVVWEVVSVPKDWQANSVTVVGQVACVPGDTRFLYKCTSVTSDAKTGAAYPADFAQPQINEALADNHVTWQPVPAGSIFLHSESVKISHCIFRGGYGYGVLIDSGYFGPGLTNYAFADLCEVSDCDYFYTGGGVHNHGPDANGSHFSRNRFFGMSIAQRTDSGHETGAGEITIWNRSQGPCFFRDNASQFTHSPAYVNDNATGATGGRLGTTGGSSSEWSGISSENGLPSCFYGAGCQVRGTSTAGTSADSTAVILEGGVILNLGWRNVANTVTGYLADGNGGYYGINPNAASNTIVKAYGTFGSGNVGAGILADVIGPYAGVLGGRPNCWRGVTTTALANVGGGGGPGQGLDIVYDGYIRGRSVISTPASAPYHAEDSAMLTHTALRYGQRVVDDSFPIPGATNAIGTYRRVVCTVAGWRAPKWTAGTGYAVEQAATFYQEAVQVEPSTQPAVYSDGTGYVWRLMTLTLANNGVEPVWPSIGSVPIGSTFTDAIGNVWKRMGITAVFANHDRIDDPVQIFVQAMANSNQTISTTRREVQTTGALTASKTLTWNGATAGDLRVLDNQCTGLFAVKVSPAIGDLSTNGVANGKCATIYFDGTNWRRASPDATP